MVISKYVCVCVYVCSLVCIDARATLEICYGSRLLLLLFAATCNLRQTRLTSSSHTWKNLQTLTWVCVSFFYLLRCFSSFYFSTILWAATWPVDSATYTHAHTHTHTQTAVCVKISTKTSSAGFCYEQVSERERARTNNALLSASAKETRTSSTFFLFRRFV